MEYTIGIDDAGRGPVIGSMFLAGVLVTRENEDFFKKQQIKDSKLLTHSQRIRLSKLIRENCISHKVLKASPKEIDEAVNSGANLNTLEAKEMAEVINSLNNKKDKIRVIIDCPSVNIAKWQEKLIEFIEHSENLSVKCEHKADVNHVSVSAASILAKVAREEEVEHLKKGLGVDFGSGYPADPITAEFLGKRGMKYLKHGIIRESWQTWKEIMQKRGQKKLF